MYETYWYKDVGWKHITVFDTYAGFVQNVDFFSLLSFCLYWTYTYIVGIWNLLLSKIYWNRYLLVHKKLEMLIPEFMPKTKNIPQNWFAVQWAIASITNTTT